MKKLLPLLLVLAGCGGTPEPRTDVPEARPRWVVILHTNDIHGRVQNLSRLSATMKKVRAEEEAKGARVILVDCGDSYQGTLDGDLPKGRMVIEIMNEMGYDALCLGNHEFDKGREPLRALSKLAKFPFLGANIIDEKTGTQPDWIRDSVTIAGVRLVGVISPAMNTLVSAEANKGLRFEHPLKTLSRYPGSVVLSHCGHELERQFKGEFVIGGHSHQRISEPAYQQAGSWARILGYVRLGDKPEAKLLRVGKESDPAVDRIIARYAPEIDAIRNEVIGRVTHNMSRRAGMKSSLLGNYLCDIMREAAKADIAFHNRTGIRSNLKKGVVTFDHIYQVSPFGNTIVAMDLKGSDVLDLLERGLTGGTKIFLEISGFEFTYDPRGPPGKRVKSSTLDRKKTYRVATNSFLAGGGDGHGVFKKGTNRKDTFLDIMDAHRDHLKKNSPLRYEFKNRIHSPD